jgi:hypothetical protein
MKTVILLFLFINSFCFAQTGLIEINASAGNYYEGLASSLSGSGCSLACAMDWTLSATSVHLENDKLNYGIENLNDGIPNTAWVEGAEGYGIGEKIFARIKGDRKTVNVSFWGIRIANGYQQDSSTWNNYSRVKKLKVIHNSKPILIINLPDKMGVLTAKWNANLMRLNNGDLITFEILDVYKGDKYENTALSDLVLDGAH